MSSPTSTPNPSRRRGLAAALLGATCLVGAGLAYGQSMGFAYDPAQLPETKGTLRQYTLTPRGDVDGLILQDGTEVKVPPHLSAQIVFAVKPGDAITVRGLRAAALPLVSATQIRNDATGATVQDDGGPRAAEARPDTLVTGRIAIALHGPRGEVNGVLLDNGMTVRMSPEDAYRLGAALQPSQPLSVRGTVTATLLGQVMEARAVGTSPEQLTYVSRPPKPPKPPKEAREDRGPKGDREDRGPRRTAAFGPPPLPPYGAPPPAPGAAPPPPAFGAPPPPVPGAPPPPAGPDAGPPGAPLPPRP